MKKFLLTIFTATSVIGSSFGQSSIKFKPTKEEIYFANGEDWAISSTKKYTYNTKGNILTTIELNAAGIPSRKDSNVYSDEQQLLEIHKFNWNIPSGKFVNSSKQINCFTSKGTSCGERVYSWLGGWVLSSGIEEITTSDPGNSTEIALNRLYDKPTQTWKDQTRRITHYDENNQEDSIIYQYVHPDTKQWTNSSKVKYFGWHNYAESIYKVRTTDEFEEGKWYFWESSTLDFADDLWIETLKRYKPDGTLEETYRIIETEDESLREVYKAFGENWLLISSSETKAHISTLIMNAFEEDVLESVEKWEHEFNEYQRPTRSVQQITDGDNNILEYYEVGHELSYSPQNLLLVDVSYFKSSQNAEFEPYQKVVYSDYVEIDMVTSIVEVAENELTIYPNPGNGRFFFSNAEGTKSVSVYNSTGNLVSQQKVNGNELDLTGLTKGVYLLRFNQNEKTTSQKVVIE